MPFLAALSYRNIKTLEAEESNLQLKKAPVYFQSMVMQGGLAFLAYRVTEKEKFHIGLTAHISFSTIAASLCFLAASLSLAYFSQRNKTNQDKSTLQYLLPENGRERILWVLAVLVAAFCEEFIYRGVLYQIILQQTDGIIWAATLLAAIVFGFGHGTQGERAVLQIIPFAIGFHILAIMSEGLLLPMIVHFIYNICVELFFGKKIRKQ
jgi:membrane protease YdiL (CAAX protease family)